MAEKTRCSWADGSDEYRAYHDEEWGVPVHDDRHFFEMLVLEGAQAGLSWSTILHKRAAYRKAFSKFDPRKVARFGALDKRALLANEGIVRNRLKIDSAIRNAAVFLEIQREFGSFDSYVWKFVGGKPIVLRSPKVPASTEESDAMSKDLKKRGMNFVGSTILYAFMQATGLVNDHAPTCFRAPRAKR
jgi:DNA-3-methyladenine glycosylase I